MRITTKVIQNNSLRNINTNKLLQDKLSQQMSTEKKINRPSDDPIIAIRALRLRTNVNQITQYYEKNVPDAESWLEVTEGALASMSDVITDMYDKCVKGSNEDLKLEDRKIILTALEALRDEVYATGNSDYAGRYVFTGYRTDTPLTFIDDTKKLFEITEQLDAGKIDSVTYVDSGNILDINDTNFKIETTDQNGDTTVTPHSSEYDVKATEVHRIRLAYDEVAAAVPKIEVWNENKQRVDAEGNLMFDDQNNPVMGDYDDLANVMGINPATDLYKTVSIYDGTDPYEEINQTANDNKIIMVKETGELLLGKNVYDKLINIKDNALTNAKEGEIRITYSKEEWKEGDLKPEHYFRCETTTDDGRPLEYNGDYLLGISDEDKQTIEYDVGLNQTIRVNTTADEVFLHDIGRDVDDLIRSMEDSIKMEEQVLELEKLLEKYTDPQDQEMIQKDLDAANKALVYLKEKTQKLFEGGMTKMQGHLDVLNFAVTENGTRGQKLELISNRLMSQKTNFETLKSENEDIDITDVAIKLSSAELTYSSALMATGKVLQNSLMNFI